jgi:hypothetical protein
MQIGNTSLYRLHVDLRIPGSWQIVIPREEREPVKQTIEIQEGAPLSWRMAAWYLWPFVIVMLYSWRELSSRRRPVNTHRHQVVRG